MIATRLQFGIHFAVILEALGSLLTSRSDLGEILEGFENEVGERDVPGGAAAFPRPEPQEPQGGFILDLK